MKALQLEPTGAASVGLDAGGLQLHVFLHVYRISHVDCRTGAICVRMHLEARSLA